MIVLKPIYPTKRDCAVLPIPIVVPPPKEYNFKRFTFSLFNKIIQIDKHGIY